MNTKLFFFTVPTVSKSLLIVWGTSPLPGKNGRGKYLSTALEFLMMTCPQCWLIFPLCKSAGNASARRPANPAFFCQQAALWILTKNIFPLFCQLYWSAVCPCQGSGLNSHARNYALENLNLDLPANLASLDNSTRFTVAG
jgi:hypothetical protein